MSRAIDMIITYRVVKLLVTTFEKMEAFKRGIIDKDGKVLIKFKQVLVAIENIILFYIDLFLI